MAASASSAEEGSDSDRDALCALPVSGAVAGAVLGGKVAFSHNFPRFWIE
jgi:hypothetical protein